MGYSAITASEIAIKKPITNALWTKVKDNFDAIYGLLAPGAGFFGVPNFSMEIDADSSGVPDGWAKGLYPGGAGVFDTTTPYHGAAAFKFTHPGGAGNGGGYLTSDYIEISDAISPLVQFATKSSAAAMKNQVYMAHYDKAKSLLSEELLWSSTSNPADWTHYTVWAQPPTGARYAKLALIGGYTDTDVAGDAYFDVGLVDPFPKIIPAWFSFTTYTSASASWADVASYSLNVPKGFGSLNFNAQGECSAGPVGNMRFRISTTYSNTFALSGIAVWTDYGFELLVGSLPGAQTLYMQLQGNGSFGPSGKKDCYYGTYNRY